MKDGIINSIMYGFIACIAFCSGFYTSNLWVNNLEQDSYLTKKEQSQIITYKKNSNRLFTVSEDTNSKIKNIISDLQSVVFENKFQNIELPFFADFNVLVEKEDFEINAFDKDGGHTGFLEPVNKNTNEVRYESNAKGTNFINSADYDSRYGVGIPVGENINVTLVSKKVGMSYIDIDVSDSGFDRARVPVGNFSILKIPFTEKDIGPILYDVDGDGNTDLKISTHEDIKKDVFLKLMTAIFALEDMEENFKISLMKEMDTLKPTPEFNAIKDDSPNIERILKLIESSGTDQINEENKKGVISIISTYSSNFVEKKKQPMDRIMERLKNHGSE